MATLNLQPAAFQVRERTCYDAYQELFPPGEPDEAARARA